MRPRGWSARGWQLISAACVPQEVLLKVKALAQRVKAEPDVVKCVWRAHTAPLLCMTAEPACPVLPRRTVPCLLCMSKHLCERCACCRTLADLQLPHSCREVGAPSQGATPSSVLRCQYAVVPAAYAPGNEALGGRFTHDSRFCVRSREGVSWSPGPSPCCLRESAQNPHAP